jgi:hypothetical protein
MIDSKRWRQVRDLFERVYEQRPGDVGAWLDREGVSDWQIREELMSLIQHHGSAGAFLVEAADVALGELGTDSEPLEPGQVLGKYTIVRELGRGGMGRVYLAKDGQLGRLVALKALSPDLAANPSHRERLQREAGVGAGLNHPGICTVHALEEFFGVLFIVSEYVDGHTLRAEIGGLRPTAEQVVQLARELAGALGHAHAIGIVHRDLKPENVMRTSDGRLKILDFGLARIETPTGETVGMITQPGAVLGTPGYMAPEQLNGQRGDARSDVFSLGVLLYEYACGVHPFAAETALAMIGRILEGDVEAIDRRRSDLPVSFVNAIERSLAKRPADRFASATEMARGLERVDSVRGRMTSWWRIHQLVVIALYFVASALAWQVKEWQSGLPTAAFLAIGVAATVAGIARGHLLFVERVNVTRFMDEYVRVARVLLVADLLLAATLVADGLLLATIRPLAGVLTVALGVGIAAAHLIVEPARVSASFKPQH